MALPDFQTALVRVGSGVLYSTILFAAGTTLSNVQATFFAYGQGAQATGYAAGTTSTYCETNLRGNGGQIPGQLAFVADGISVTYSNFSARAPVSSSDLHNIMDNGTVLRWNYLDTDTIVIAPLASIPAGAGMMGVAGTNGAIPSELSMGPGSFKFPRPVQINPLQTFGIIIQFPLTAAAPVVSTGMRVTLYGTYKTAVAAG